MRRVVPLAVIAACLVISIIALFVVFLFVDERLKVTVTLIAAYVSMAFAAVVLVFVMVSMLWGRPLKR